MVVAVVCFTAFFSGIVTVAAADVAASTTAEESTNIKSEHGASNAAQLRAKQKQLSILKLRLQELTRRITNLENEIKGIKVRGQEREGQSNFGRPQHSDKGTASSTVGISCIKDNQKYPLGAELISPSTIYPAPRLVCTNMNGKGVWESVSAAVATTTSVAPRVTFVAEKDRLINATVVLPRPSQPRAVTGPTGLGTIAWGDGVTESLIGLVSGTEMTVKTSHRYNKSGTFTVVVTDSNGKTVSQKVVVSTSTPRTATPTPSTAVPSGLTAPAAGAVRGATTDVYQNIATVLVSLKQFLDTLEAK